MTVTFLTLAFAQLWQVFNMRASGSKPFRNEVTRNPWVWAALLLCTALLVGPAYLPAVAAVLGLAPLDWIGWTLVLSASLAPLAVVQLGTLIVGALKPSVCDGRPA